MKDGWYIPHPGNLEWIACESFEQAMDKWFEGFNLPRLVTNGKPDTFKEAYDRVSKALAKK